MSKKNVIAQSSVIDAAFKQNPHFVDVWFTEYVVNSYSAITYMEPGDELLFLEDADLLEDEKIELREKGSSAIVKATETGYFVPALGQSAQIFSKEEIRTSVLGWIFERPIDAVDYLIGTPTVEKKIDPFTKTNSLQFEWDGLLQCNGCFQIANNLFIKLDYIENTCVLSFFTSADQFFDGLDCRDYTEPDYSLSANDTISILFDDDTILDFKSVKKKSFCCVFHQEDFDAFTQKEIEAVQITFAKSDMDAISMAFANCFFGVYSQLAVMLYIKKFLETIVEVHPNYILPDRAIGRLNNNEQGCCFVYLMQDTTNSYYKIGISNNPDYRERTLQSEKPSIEMITCKQFPNRKIALSIESALHSAYKEQRIRGEWFNLTDSDVAAIIETLK